MHTDWIALPTADDFRMEAYHVAPDGNTAAPIVIVLQEIFGVNATMREVAHNFAREGFEVFAPDLFWRVGPRISLDYDGPDRARATEIMREFDTELALADIGRLIAWLGQRSGDPRRVAAVGFCIGGQLATLLGARGQIDLGVSFYGVQLDNYVDEIAGAKSRLLLHFGGQDAQIPLTLVERIEMLSKPNPLVDVRFYPEAKHGFFNPTRADRHHAQASAQAAATTSALLREVLDLPAAS